MSKSKKVLLYMSLAMAFVCFLLSKMLSMVDDGKKAPLVYPESNLSNDLFVSQNTEYIKNDSFSEIYEFKNIPFNCDVLKGNTADIENGHIINVSEDVNFFVSEYENGKNPHDIILRQYPQAIYMNYAKENSFVQTATTDIGYINGYYATYFVDHLLISTGPTASGKSAYMIGYALDLGTQYEYDLIIAVVTTTQSTENFEACKQLLDTMTYTLRYDEKRAEQMEKAKQRAYEEEQKALEEYQKTSQNVEGTLATNTTTATSSRIPVKVNRDFADMAILITWENPVENPIITFENAQGLVIGTPSTLGSKQAIINAGMTAQGEYILSCSHYMEAGNISVKLVEN